MPLVDPDLMAEIVTAACDLALVVSPEFAIESVDGQVAIKEKSVFLVPR